MARDQFRYFRVEARELLEQLGQGVLDLEKGRPHPDLVARLLRLAHTLKGAARVVKQQEIADHAHALEDALAPLRDAGEAAPRNQIDLLLALLDSIGSCVAALTPPTASAPDVAGSVSEQLFRAFRPDVHDMDVLLNTMAEAHGRLASLHSFVRRVERSSHLADLVVDHLDSSGGRDSSRSGERVATERARSLAQDLRAAFATLERDLSSHVDSVEREFREARSAAERLRLVPVSALFTLLERTARDAAQALGKQVVFEGRGSDVRVDVQILGTAQSALLQMVRNAVAHGIEPPPDRTAAGKTPDGRVSVHVIRRGNRIVFRCEDDGRGVDLEAVRRLARRKGLLSAETEAFGPRELLDLLLKGGISTSGSVTDVSGRGIGLDVVREAAERLSGDVSVQTEAGHGTAIELSAPFTLASLPVLGVESSGVKAFVPLDAVRGSMRIPPDAIVRTAQDQSVLYDGGSVPLGILERVLLSRVPPVRAGGPASAVVVQARTGTAAFAVDRVLGTGTVVVQPLPDLAPAAAYIAGAALDEEGVPQIVLDPDALVAALGQSFAGGGQPSPVRPSVLVIDDSLTTRMLEQSILESAGYLVDLATSGEEGLAKARETRYALFLVDVEMPGMDGFTFVERTRAEPALHGTPSILVTSRSSPEDRRRGQEAGARAYIVKSEFDQGELLERIRELVGA
jgi:two-component system chemotaxis sensor kinase CheA